MHVHNCLLIGRFMLIYHCIFLQSQFTEKKSVDKYDLPTSYQLLSESGEATSAMLDKKVSVHALLCLLCWLSCGCCCVCHCITHLLFILQFCAMQTWTII